MDEPKQITEDFVETASSKISHILCDSQDKNIYKWAVRFLQRSARGFGAVEHEPWIGALSALQCSEVILSNYKPHLRKPNLNVETLASTLPLLLRSPLHVDDFISELVTLFLHQNEITTEEVITNAFLDKRRMTRDKICHEPHSSTDIPDAYCDIYSTKRRKVSQNSLLINNSGVKDLFHNIWIWARNGKIKLAPEILGELLAYLPECVEEAMIEIALKVMKNNIEKDSLFCSVYDCAEEKVGSAVDNEAVNVLNVLRDFAMFTEAAAASPKLFQMCSSILSQLSILSAGCACSWSPMLFLSTIFAKETAKGRSVFYPLPMQSVVTLMEADPHAAGLEIYKKDVIHYHLKNVFMTQPPEAMVALLSHFPAWLPYIDPISYLYQN